MINPEEENWYELRLPGKHPERRGYHSSFIYNKKYYSLIFTDDRLYIYGGHDIREGSLDNLWMLDINKLE